MNMLLLVLKLFVSIHHLNFEGFLTFMFCYSMKDKLNTTLLCFSMLETNLKLSSALLFMIFYLCYFSCCNIVAKLYCQNYIYHAYVQSTLILAYNAFTIMMIKIVLAACHLKNYFVITYLLEDENKLSLGMLIRCKCIYTF